MYLLDSHGLQTPHWCHVLCIHTPSWWHTRVPTVQHSRGARTRLCSPASVCRAHCRRPSLPHSVYPQHFLESECWHWHQDTGVLHLNRLLAPNHMYLWFVLAILYESMWLYPWWKWEEKWTLQTILSGWDWECRSVPGTGVGPGQGGL